MTTQRSSREVSEIFHTHPPFSPSFFLPLHDGEEDQYNGKLFLVKEKQPKSFHSPSLPLVLVTIAMTMMMRREEEEEEEPKVITSTNFKVVLWSIGNCCGGVCSTSTREMIL